MLLRKWVCKLKFLWQFIKLCPTFFTILQWEMHCMKGSLPKKKNPTWLEFLWQPNTVPDRPFSLDSHTKIYTAKHIPTHSTKWDKKRINCYEIINKASKYFLYLKESFSLWGNICRDMTSRGYFESSRARIFNLRAPGELKLVKSGLRAHR